MQNKYTSNQNYLKYHLDFINLICVNQVHNLLLHFNPTQIQFRFYET
jgi:hypothetical protein